MERKQRWLEELKTQLRTELRALAMDLGPLPRVMTRERAARELSIGPTKLKSLIRDGVISECPVGDRKMIPASEIYRLSQPIRVKARTSGGRPKVSTYDAKTEAQKGRDRLKAKRKARRKLRS